ncbi:hypothetical protein BAUCODRAFT_29542 [Baudoinia panamericana UAMH 10762]|uniref:Uncharacterized protein n=1 Tax=Baudoinia panamericana (strain UAMH 10762) TaxID=717646 RepID=M2NA91_BAUPA|nr:uncharacterized protein BAUCODRAFT_29542 [Baudoinia panamericana UAMH 10762]EMD01139.1 hypothetical protein BAUCODRAFT_29542 [Baudoinia panamericana UAMH 10762]
MPAYGRGGAGNILSIEQENARASADLEANQQAAESDQKGPLPTDYLEKSEQQYAHTGRGGMGNYYSPRDLSETGHFNDAHRSHILGEGTSAPPATGDSTGNGPPSYGAGPSDIEPPRKHGRGGAGNYAFGVSESEERAAQRRLEQEKRQEQLKADIEKGVKESLAAPPKAKLPGGNPY